MSDRPSDMAVSLRGLTTGSVAPSRARRRAAGKALRRRVPRSRHGAWTPRQDRPDPVDLLRASDRRRVRNLLPIRYGRMSLSPWTFFRGSATLMAYDLAGSPATGFRVQLSGDAHAGNFGVFATPERERVFDVNDFDETLPGPWEWDLKRLATSLVVLARANRLAPAVGAEAARAAVAAYRERMDVFARWPYLESWYFHLDRRGIERTLRGSEPRAVDRALARAHARTSARAFPELVEKVRGRYRIRDDPPRIVHYRDPADLQESTAFFREYSRTLPEERRTLLERYRPIDLAQKVVGVGSVGTVCSVMLLVSDLGRQDPLFLQLKQALPSALEPYLGRSRFENPAERVVTGQRLMQEASDVLLGWGSLGAKAFYVRQLRDMRSSPDLSALGPKGLRRYAALCGIALARGHARTGDPAGISGYLGTSDRFDRALAEFAVHYAVQVEHDHRALLRAIRRGQIPARPDL